MAGPAEQVPAPAAPSTPGAKRASGALALTFAVAAGLACWNPLAAPFAFVVGAAAAVMGRRALRRGAGRAAAAALAIGLLAALGSVVILALTAGAVGVELSGEPVVHGRTSAQLDQALDEAAQRTRDERERARRELERLAAPDAGPPRHTRP